MELYERKYIRIQDVLSNIGGISEAIFLIATYINFLYNKFIILSDTEAILNSLIYTEKRIHKKKSQYFQNFNDKMKDIEKSLENDIKRKTDRKKNKTDSNNKNKTRKNNNIENSINTNNSISKTNFKSLKKELKNLKNQDSKEIRRIETLNMLKHNSKNKKLSNYICFKISCGKKENYFKIYENFRTKIISEEHLIRNHLNLYNILKVTEKKRHTLKNKYHLEDLIKFI